MPSKWVIVANATISGMGWCGAAFVAYAVLAGLTGEPWDPVERIAGPIFFRGDALRCLAHGRVDLLLQRERASTKAGQLIRNRTCCDRLVRGGSVLALCCRVRSCHTR
jgi:hypothetical protein